MQKNYYYLKEILLGLKDEYIEMDKELEKLKQLAIVTNQDKLKNFYFWISQFINNEIKLKCTIERKKNKLQELIEEFTRKNGMYVYGKTNRTCNINDAGNTIIKDRDSIILGTTDEFGQQAKKILSSEFTNNIYIPEISSIETSLNSILEINHSFIYYLYLIGQNHINLEYRPTEPNLLHININDEKCDEKRIRDILYSKFSRSNFTEYHQRVIDANPSTIKPIEIMNIPTQLNKYGNLSETMELTEQESKIVLKKIKK